LTVALVTGAAGFVGSHLCESLLDDGYEVVALDNLCTGSPANVAHMADRPGFELIQADVRALPRGLHPDVIYNLACPASPVQYERDPIATIETSVIGAINVLHLAARCGARVLQASTSEVYGDPVEHPQTEHYRGNVDMLGARSCYDEGKRCAETLFMHHHRNRGVDVKIVRIFNTYGPRMQPDDGRVVSNFIVQALGNEPLTLYGDGMQTRSFMYVSDLIAGLRTMMESPKSFTGPVNLGNPDERTIRDIARIIVRQCTSRSTLEFRPLPENDPTRRQPDIGRARRNLGWQPTVGLDEGLASTIEYFRQQLRSDTPAPLKARGARTATRLPATVAAGRVRHDGTGGG
jgi:UDP-glucuronate decarboxylase